MSKSRALFKYALRYCKKTEKQTVADRLADDLCDSDYVEFWKQVNKLNGKRTPLSSTVGGATGSQHIADMWKEHFSNLLSQKTTNINRHCD